MGSQVVPPLPPGFTLDGSPASGGGLPPLPPGFRLDRAKPAGASQAELDNLADTEDDASGSALMMRPDQIEAQKAWAPVVGGLVAAPVAGAALGSAGPAVARVVTSPVGSGAIAGALNYARTGSLVSAGEAAIKQGSEMAIMGSLGTIAKALPFARAVPASLLARATHLLSSAAIAKMPAAAAELLPAVEAAAPEVEAVAPAAASAGESLLETRLRASILQKQNPMALTNEIVDKVKTLKEGVGKGLSAAQVGTSLEDLYGLGKSEAKNMAKMIFETFGYK